MFLGPQAYVNKTLPFGLCSIVFGNYVTYFWGPGEAAAGLPKRMTPGPFALRLWVSLVEARRLQDVLGSFFCSGVSSLIGAKLRYPNTSQRRPRVPLNGVHGPPPPQRILHLLEWERLAIMAYRMRILLIHGCEILRCVVVQEAARTTTQTGSDILVQCLLWQAISLCCHAPGPLCWFQET